MKLHSIPMKIPLHSSTNIFFFHFCFSFCLYCVFVVFISKLIFICLFLISFPSTYNTFCWLVSNREGKRVLCTKVYVCQLQVNVVLIYYFVVNCCCFFFIFPQIRKQYLRNLIIFLQSNYIHTQIRIVLAVFIKFSNLGSPFYSKKLKLTTSKQTFKV